jgi:hypothetical protein
MNKLALFVGFVLIVPIVSVAYGEQEGYSLVMPENKKEYEHNVFLSPSELCEATISCDEGDTIKIDSCSLDDNAYSVEILDPFKRPITSFICRFSNYTYTIPASGQYTIRIKNINLFSDVMVGYTITREYKILFVIPRSSDIKLS